MPGTTNNANEPVAELMPTAESESITPFSDVIARFEVDERTSFFLSTVRQDGRPHTVPVGAAWVDGGLYFTTGQGTQKGKNLEQNPHCTIGVSNGGYDIVFEGEAALITDEAKLTKVAAHYAKRGWPAYVHDGVLDAPFSAPTTGPAPYDVYEITPSVAFAFGTTDDTVKKITRYRF